MVCCWWEGGKRVKISSRCAPYYDLKQAVAALGRGHPLTPCDCVGGWAGGGGRAPHGGNLSRIGEREG